MNNCKQTERQIISLDKELFKQTGGLFIFSNQYISDTDTLTSYPKQVFRNNGEIKYLGEISTGYPFC